MKGESADSINHDDDSPVDVVEMEEYQPEERNLSDEDCTYTFWAGKDENRSPDLNILDEIKEQNDNSPPEHDSLLGDVTEVAEPPTVINEDECPDDFDTEFSCDDGEITVSKKSCLSACCRGMYRMVTGTYRSKPGPLETPLLAEDHSSFVDTGVPA